MARTTVVLSQRYTIHILDPREGHDDGDPVWQVLIEGIPEPSMEKEGLFFHPKLTGSQLFEQLRYLLYLHISSGVVDREWKRIEQACEDAYGSYANA